MPMVLSNIPLSMPMSVGLFAITNLLYFRIEKRGCSRICVLRNGTLGLERLRELLFSRELQDSGSVMV